MRNTKLLQKIKDALNVGKTVISKCANYTIEKWSDKEYMIITWIDGEKDSACNVDYSNKLVSNFIIKD